MKALLVSILFLGGTLNYACSQSSISGKVYNDINGNTAYDAGEELTPIKVWLFNMDAVAPYYRVQPIAEVFTDVSGDYSFPGITAGNYQVRVGVSSLPATLCRAVQDNDSYPNGLTNIYGVNGTSNYNNINFGFAANVTVPGFTSQRSFKWNSSNTFTGGQLSQSYSLPPETVSGTTYYPNMTWGTNKTCSPGGIYGTAQYPSAVSGIILPDNWPGTGKGGIRADDSTFQIMNGGINCYNGGDSDKQVTTIGFSLPVKDVKFSMYDIDHADPQASTGRIDHVKITGYYFGVPVMPVIINPSAAPWNIISGNTVTGFADYPLINYSVAFNSQNEDHGTVNVYFSQSVTSIEIIYQEFAPVLLPGKGINNATPPVSATSESLWSDRLPTTRGIGIGGVDYSIDNAYILPVKLVSFSAREKNCNTELKWTISSAQNLKNFEIEKSKDDGSFIVIGTQAYKSIVSNYSFTDAEGGYGNRYYRLRMVDYDGQSAESAIVSTAKNCNGRNVITIIPNPVVNKTILVYMSGFEKGSYKMVLFNYLDQACATSVVNINESGIAQKNIEMRQLTGFCVLKTFGPDGNLISSKKILLK